MMTKRERLTRMAGLAVSMLPLAPAQATGQQVVIPADTVTTVFVTDTFAGFGAVGGAALGLAPGHALAKARLELVDGAS